MTKHIHACSFEVRVPGFGKGLDGREWRVERVLVGFLVDGIEHHPLLLVEHRFVEVLSLTPG